MIYLASPYTDRSRIVMRTRFKDACKAAGAFARHNVRVYSPIAHSHPIAIASSLPTSWQYWKGHSEEMLAMCDELWILMLDGWDKSRGVLAEIEIAVRLALPIRYVSPADYSFVDEACHD